MGVLILVVLILSKVAAFTKTNKLSISGMEVKQTNQFQEQSGHVCLAQWCPVLGLLSYH